MTKEEAINKLCKLVYVQEQYYMLINWNENLYLDELSKKFKKSKGSIRGFTHRFNLKFKRKNQKIYNEANFCMDCNKQIGFKSKRCYKCNGKARKPIVYRLYKGKRACKKRKPKQNKW